MLRCCWASGEWQQPLLEITLATHFSSSQLWVKTRGPRTSKKPQLDYNSDYNTPQSSQKSSLRSRPNSHFWTVSPYTPFDMPSSPSDHGHQGLLETCSTHSRRHPTTCLFRTLCRPLQRLMTGRTWRWKENTTSGSMLTWYGFVRYLWDNFWPCFFRASFQIN